ncbi:NUDIX domain-containing protein [Cohnella nanjingensis]|uniref:NUDIX domain-containing protein n=1 Tax=Cohnella nanjingensis TaxID=1387779 RepID=A0A7X0VG72_9BACL|nr:NUDIX domain-containing protein [Cohnella nanjingensis]MBB6672820.1 NUDIX domain-containing protein [Cohnella nanjingensis]
MPMSEYYRSLRRKIGTQLIFNPGVAAIVRDARGDILFQRPSADSDVWSLPAGSIEPGETPAEAVVREVWEETGLRVTPERLSGVFGGKDFRYTYPDGNQVEYVILMFECAAVGGHLEAIDGESAELRYFPSSAPPPLALPYPRDIFLQTESERARFQLPEAFEDGS